MNKIASPTELQAEIRSLLAFIHGHGPDGKPDRQVIAAKLHDLADRTAMEDLFAADGFSMEAAGSVAEATFKKLRDGSWGLLVNSGYVRPGDRVLTVTKAGKRSYKVVGKIVWSGNGVSITTIDEAAGEGSQQRTQPQSPSPSGKASPRQVSLAWTLVQKLVRSGGWFDSAFGDGMPAPSKSDLEGMTSREISQFIDELKSEF